MQTTKTELLDLLRRKDLLRASLLAGKVANPNFKMNDYVEGVFEIANFVWEKIETGCPDVILKIEVINWALFDHFHFEGKTDKYKQLIDDPNRYYLHKVIDKKQGCPLSMVTLYGIILQQLGIEFQVFALPNHYFIKVQDVAGDIYIEPFDHGKILKAEDFHRRFRMGLERNRMISTNLFEKMGYPELVAKLLQQLKHIYILKGEALVALRAVELLSVLYPDSPEITRDRGILYCEMEYFSKAMDDLRFYLQKRPDAEDVPEIKRLTSMLKVTGRL